LHVDPATWQLPLYNFTTPRQVGPCYMALVNNVQENEIET